MNLKPLHPCYAPACGALTRERFCEQHKSLANAGRSSTEMGYDYQWQKARKSHLELYPLCTACGRLANTVDHIVPHKGNKRLFWDRSNWQSMCHSCHSKKTATEDMGGWNNKLK